eukprot:9341102-Ditylum_brightwellii.AAC.1
MADAKALMMQGIFRKRTKKGKADSSMNVCIRLIFNGKEEDRKELRKTINDKLNKIVAETLKVDSRTTLVWFSKLQNHPRPKLAGLLHYSNPNINFKHTLKQVLKVIKEVHSYEVEASLILEPAFADNLASSKFYKMYNRTDPNSIDKLKQRKITTAYCNLKFIGTFCTHMCAAFIENANKKYINKNTNCNTPSEQLVLGSNRVTTTALKSTVDLTEDVIPEVFQTPFSKDRNIKLNKMMPQTMIMTMSRSEKDPNTAVYQVGLDRTGMQIMGNTVPGLARFATTFVSHNPHYIKAVLKEMGGERSVSRILSPSALTRIDNYNYCLKSYTLTSMGPHYPKFKSLKFILKEFNKVVSVIQSRVTILPQPNDIIELGSKASCQARKKKKPKNQA